MAENWYIALELDFDPPEEDEAVIARRITEKQKFWASNSTDFREGARYRTLNDSITQIRKDMIGPANKRRVLATEARVKVYGQIDRILIIVGKKGDITTEEITKISKKYKYSVDVIRKRATVLGFNVVRSTPQDSTRLYQKFYKDKPEGYDTYVTSEKLLESLGCKDLYDFLFDGGDPNVITRLPSDMLLMKAQEKKNGPAKHDTMTSSTSRLCALCMEVFADEMSKSGYDKYLEFMKVKKLLDEVKIIAGICGQLSPVHIEYFAKILGEAMNNVGLASKLLGEFLTVEKIGCKYT